jgi:hypothetical protein
MINNKHKWIYVHPTSCAGSPVEYILERIYESHELGGLQSAKGDNFDGEAAVDHYSILDWEEKLKKKFVRYWKFSFARNPFDRCMSVYSGIVNDPKKLYNTSLEKYTFEESILNRELFKWVSPLFSDDGFYKKSDGTLGVDFIGKVETLQEDFNFVCNQLGIYSQKLPHIHKSKYDINPDVSYYSASKKYFTNEVIEIINEVFYEDIEWYKDKGIILK